MHDYYAFGLEASDPTQDAEPTRFTSQETDLHNTSGQTDDLINMHARFYHPILARFLSADLLSGNPHSPQSFNLFAYVSDNPTNYWDPYGMKITLTRAGQIVVTANDPCREAPQGISCQTWWDILAAGGWASRDAFFFGTASGVREDGGGHKSLREKICSALPSGRTFGVSGTFGGLGAAGGGGELLLNYNTGQVSAFGFGVGGVGWNGALQVSAYTGFVRGIVGDNSNYSGGFSGYNGGWIGGVFHEWSSEGLSGLVHRGPSALPANGPVRVTGFSLSWTPVNLPTGGLTAADYSKPSQLGRLWAFTPIDGLIYEARQVFCK